MNDRTTTPDADHGVTTLKGTSMIQHPELRDPEFFERFMGFTLRPEVQDEAVAVVGLSKDRGTWGMTECDAYMLALIRLTEAEIERDKRMVYPELLDTDFFYYWFPAVTSELQQAIDFYQREWDFLIEDKGFSYGQKQRLYDSAQELIRRDLIDVLERAAVLIAQTRRELDVA